MISSSKMRESAFQKGMKIDGMKIFLESFYEMERFVYSRLILTAYL